MRPLKSKESGEEKNLASFEGRPEPGMISHLVWEYICEKTPCELRIRNYFFCRGYMSFCTHAKVTFSSFGKFFKLHKKHCQTSYERYIKSDKFSKVAKPAIELGFLALCHRLASVTVTWTNWDSQYLCSPLDGLQVHRRVSPSSVCWITRLCPCAERWREVVSCRRKLLGWPC